MTIRIGNILPVLAIGVLTLPLGGCPKDAQQSATGFLSALGVNDGVGRMQAAEGAPAVLNVPVVEPEPCFVPSHLFRQLQCDEAGNLIPIR
jgi:hypothetical protein